MKKIIIGCVFLFVALASKAQVDQFRSSDEEFMEDIKSFLSQKDKKFAKNFVKEFSGVYTSKFSQEQKKKIIDFSNELLKKRLKFNPEFTAYFNAIKGIANSSKFSKKEMDDWTNIVGKLIKIKNKKRLAAFLIFSDKFYNKSELNSKNNSAWNYRNATYEFVYDKNAFVKFKKLKLVCHARNDSTVIYQASGDFKISTGVFLGNAGVVTWERVKLPKNKVYAELSNYKINTKSPGFYADSVWMHSTYLPNPVLGKLKEKVNTFKTAEGANFPFFNSYDEEIEIKNILPNVDYKGKFSFKGLNFKGGATGKNKASIILKRKGKKFFESKSKELNISPEKVISQNSSAIFYLNSKETIIQNNCDFTYYIHKKEVVLSKENNKNIDYPCFSSFHKMSIHTERITWKEGSNKLLFGSFVSMGKSVFTIESEDYFDSKKYAELRYGKINLAKKLHEFYLTSGQEDTVTSYEFATYVKVSEGDLIKYYFLMSNLGLIHYDYTKKTILIHQKLGNYINSGRDDGDYDDLFILSNTKKTENAILDLKTLEIEMEGIRNFFVSKKKFVKIYPKKGKVKIGKNRKIEFSGVINAGRTEYFGKEIQFDYSNFSLSSSKLDSMRIRVYPFEDSGSGPKQVRLISKLYNLEGKILIDDISNKSGKNKKYSSYPILEVTNSPKIYYNQQEICNGVYKKEDFYFEVSPFKMDSLLIFSNSGIKFSGKLYTANIFPVIEEDLYLMQDYVLGFSNIDEKGSLYKSDAKYDDKLTLNKEGLVGTGKLNYLTSSASSEKIAFFPDSLIAKTGLYINKSQTLPSLPEIVGKNCLITFQPHKGVWKTSTLDSAMSIYEDGKTKFTGDIVLHKGKMNGEGKISSGRINVFSKILQFKQFILQANSADFTINGANKNDPPSLEATDMKMKLDFTKRKGDFTSNSGSSIIDFPINKFTAFTDEFDWEMDKNNMSFKKTVDTANFQNYDENKNLKPNFVSYLKTHEKLGFFSGLSKYSIDSNILICKGIPYIVVADSRIIPKDGTFVIKEEGELEPLQNSEIISDFKTKYHRFFDADIEIISSKSYQASGNYQVSSDKTINSKVLFSSIEPDEKGTTVAEGYITIDTNFYLSSQFKYYGKIKVKGNEIGVNYDGKTRIITKCEELALDWIEFKAIVDTSKIIIPLGEAFADKVSGPILSRDDGVTFYTSFLTGVTYDDDQAITPSEGFLSYNKEKGLFEIGAKEKLLNNNAPGNYISFDNESCSFNSIGEIKLNKDLDQFKVDLIGELRYDKLKDTALLAIGTMKIDFPFNKKALEQMSKEINEAPSEELIDLSKTNFDLYLNQYLKKEEAAKLIPSLYSNGRLRKPPKELSSTFTLFDLSFFWDETTQSFLSKGFANIATIGEEQLYKRCRVFIQIQKRGTGDRMGIFIQYKPQSYYYFGYKNGELETHSTDKVYNQIIELLPPKEKKIKGKKKEADFYFGLSSRTKPLLFLRNFESDEEGFDDGDDEEDNEEEEE